MRDEKTSMFRNRLVKVFRHLGRQAKRLQVSCYRLYDHDLPEFPFRIEFYGDKLYVAEYKRRHGLSEEAHDEWLEKSLVIMSEVLDVPGENIFLKLRQRKPGRLGQYQKHDTAGNEWVVEESGLKFIVNLSDYLDTGLFTDHRVTRQLVKEESRGKIVLNLFAYTGTFSVFAAAGGAAEVLTVDLSNTYLQWAERNMKLNGFVDEKRYRYLRADVIKYLEKVPGSYFDIIIMDPPTFSNSKRMEGILDIQRDHADLVNRCLEGLKPGGRLYFSTNFTRFRLETEKIRTGDVRDITKQTTPFDFEGRMLRYCYLITRQQVQAPGQIQD